jgi:hypothetical protein
MAFPRLAADAVAVGLNFELSSQAPGSLPFASPLAQEKNIAFIVHRNMPVSGMPGL